MSINTEKRRLSLAGTLVLKFIVPGIICACILFVVSPWRLQGIGHRTLDASMLILWLILSIRYMRLKTVEIDSTHLYISNYFEHISVPFTALRKIRRRKLRGDPITLFFSTDTLFGKKITFMPRLDEPVVVAELEARMQPATG